MVDLKTYAKSYLSIFSNKPNVFRYYNEKETKYIDILSVQYYNYKNVIFYSTIGLSNYDFGIINNKKSLRMEIIAAFNNEYKQASNMLSHCAFELIDNMSLKPNLIMENIVNEYFDTSLSAIWIKFPSLFLHNENYTIEKEDYYITTLQVLPISKKESEICMKNGGKILDEHLVKNNIDQFNIMRKET